MKHCLIVDDSRVTRKIARKLIEGLCFAVEEAQDCDKALDLCRHNMPDAILLDCQKPNAASIEFLRSVRSAPRGAKPVIVCIMIENDISCITEAVNAGANDYIMKPFDRALIAATFADTGLL